MISSEPIRRHLEVIRTARYYEIGDTDAIVDELWFVLHGYGQTALEFAEPFNAHSSAGRLIVVPEALSRFYRKLTSGDVGASWMTSEARSAEIRDYVRYLNRLYESIVEQMDGHIPMLHVLGFSQGAATASRWIASGQIKADRLVLWGGTLARELDASSLTDSFRSVPVTLVAGTTDRYLTREKVESERIRLSGLFDDFSLVEYDGAHEVDPKVLDDLMKQVS